MKILLLFTILSLSFAQMRVGDKAPPINLFRLDNNKYYHLKNEIGKNTIVLSFFATWCEPCKKEIPNLNAMLDTQKSRWGGKNRCHFIPGLIIVTF